MVSLPFFGAVAGILGLCRCRMMAPQIDNRQRLSVMAVLPPAMIHGAGTMPSRAGAAF
jgi:hypothetical protein